MSHEILRIREKILNRPQLITSSYFDTVLEYIDTRNESGIINDAPKKELAKDNSYGLSYLSNYNKDKSLGVINIEGALSYRPITLMGMDCGGASYQQIKKDFETMADAGAKTVSFIFDTPGGEAFGCFSSAKYVKDLATEQGIKLIGYVDGMAASAGYALASVMDEIIVAEGSSVGSVGVVIKLTNTSEMKKNMGITETYIYAGEDKVPFAEDGSFKEEFIKELEDDVQELYQEFVQHVATYRGLSTKDVINTQAKTYTHRVAMELGLIDKVMSPEEFYKYLDASATQPRQEIKKTPVNKLNKQEENLDMIELEALQKQLSDVEAINKTLLAEKDAALASLAALSTSTSTLTEQVEKLTAQLEALQAEKAQAVVQTRKEKLSAVLPADQVDAQLTALKDLSDESFDTVLKAFAGKVKDKENSEMFKEEGGEGVALKSRFEGSDESGDITDKLLEEKYNTNKGNK